MSFLLRESPVGLGFPDDLPAVEIEAVKHPAMDALVLKMPARVPADMRRGQFDLTDGRSDEDPFSPDDRRRPSEAGNIGFPDDVLGCAPALRQGRALAEAVGCRAAILRPVFGFSFGQGRSGHRSRHQE